MSLLGVSANEKDYITERKGINFVFLGILAQTEVTMKLTDRIALISILFILFTLWITYLSKNLIVAVTVSAFMCLIIGVLLHPRRKKSSIKTEDYLPKLCTMAKRELSEMIIKAISTDFHPKLTANGLIILDEKALVLPLLKMREISADEICKLSESVKKLSYKKLVLVLDKYDKHGFDLIKPYLHIPTEIIGIDKVLLSLEKKDSLPKVLSQKKPTKKKFLILYKNATQRKNGKYFLLTGLSTAFLSVFTPLTLYYLIFSSFSLISAIICYTKKKESVPSIII